MKLSTIEKNLARALTFVTGLRERAQQGQHDFYVSWTVYQSTSENCKFCLILFDEWGEILFSKIGNIYKSPWSMVRLGAVRDADFIRNLVSRYMERGGFPLMRENPFVQVEDSVLRVNIDWARWEYINMKTRPSWAFDKSSHVGY